MKYQDKINIQMSLIIYFALFLIGGSFIMLGMCYIGGMLFDMSYSDLLEIIMDDTLIDGYENAYNFVLSVSNFIIYVLCTVTVVYFLKKYIIDDFINFKNNIKKYSKFIVIAFVLFFISKTVVEYFVLMYSDTSENQSSIIQMLYSNYGILMIISTALLAPFIEEFIFRKAIFTYLEGRKPIVALIISTFIFAGIHIISSSGTFMELLIMSIPYAYSSLCLGIIYLKSDKNIYPAVAVHALNNIIAIIFIFL